MTYQQDWVLRQIEMVIQFVARIIFNKEMTSYEISDEQNLSQTDLLYRDVWRLVQARRIGDAEDLLFEKLETGNLKHLELALDFYQTINMLSDQQLLRAGFSRDEIQDGLNCILKKFGLESFATL